MSLCQQLNLLKIESMLSFILLKYEPVSAISFTQFWANISNYFTQVWASVSNSFTQVWASVKYSWPVFMPSIRNPTVRPCDNLNAIAQCPYFFQSINILDPWEAHYSLVMPDIRVPFYFTLPTLFIIIFTVHHTARIRIADHSNTKLHIFAYYKCEMWKPFIYANLVILATPARIIGHQVVCLGHLGGFVAF